MQTFINIWWNDNSITIWLIVVGGSCSEFKIIQIRFLIDFLTVLKIIKQTKVFQPIIEYQFNEVIQDTMLIR